MKSVIKIVFSFSVIFFVASAKGEDAGDFLKSGIEKGQARNYQGAKDDFSKAIELNPNFAEAYNERGLAEGGLAKNKADMEASLANAVSDYSNAIRLKPNFAAAYYNRGIAFQAKGDGKSARIDFAMVVKLNPKPDYILLAQTFLHLGQIAEGEGNKKAAQENFSLAYFNRGLQKQKDGDLDGALADYSKTIELDPSFFNYYICRGTVREAKEDLGGAILDYDKAIELKPDFALAYYNRGHARFNKGELEGALADYSQAIELDPTDANTFFNRGILRKKMGDLTGSQLDVNRAIELNPKMRDRLIKTVSSVTDTKAK